MALRYTQLQFQNPFQKKVIFRETGGSPDASAGEAKKDVVENYEELLKQDSDLTKENTKQVTDFITKLKEENPDQDVSQVLIKAATLTKELRRIDVANKNENSDQETIAKTAIARSSILEAAADLNISETELQKVDMMLHQVEGRLALMEAHTESAIKNPYLKFNKIENNYTIDFTKGQGTMDSTAKTAENVTSLQNILPATVKTIELTSLKYGRVALIRYSDGQYREAGKTIQDKHFPVFQGDSFKVFTDDNVQEEPGADPFAVERSNAIEAKMKAKAAQEAQTQKTGEELRDQNHNYLDEGKAMDAETSVKLPAEFLNKTGEQIQEALPRMKYGEQLKTALNTLSEIQDKKASPIGLLENIRTRELGSRNSVDFKEITREVLGMNPEKLRAEYEKVTKERLEGNPPSAETTQRWEQLNSFYRASSKLMNALKNIKTVEEAAGANFAPEEITEDGDDSLAYLEDAVDLFFDQKKEGPMVDPTLWEAIRGQKTHEITMDYSKNRNYGEKATEFKNYSEAAAWEKVRHQGLSYENGVAKYDPQKLVNNLNKYLELGKVRNAAGKDYREISELQPITTDSLKNLHGNENLALYKKAIQLGFSQNVDDETALPESSKSTDISAAMIEAAQLSPEEIKEAQAKLKEYQILTLGALINTGEAAPAEIGANVSLPLTKDGRLQVQVGFRDNMYHQTIELHAGLTGQILQTDRVNISVGGGVDVNPENGNAQLGVGVGADFGLGKKGTEHTVNIDMGVSAGINPKTAGLGLGAYLGVSRDLQAVLARKTEKGLEAASENIQDALNHYQQQLEGMEPKISQEEQIVMMDRMQRAIKENVSAQSMDDMKDVQFGAAGLAMVFVPGIGVLPVPYVNVMFKGHPYAVYESSGTNMDEAAKKQMDDACKKTLGANTITVYESGSMLESPDGGRKIGATETDAHPEEGLKKINEGLAAQGIQLESVDGKLRLNVSNARGNIDVYTDPSSGIQTFTENGSVYINLSNTDNLAIKRIDEWSMFKRDDKYQNVKIYISNDLKADPKTVRDTTDKHVHFEYKGSGLYGGASEITDQGAYTKLTETRYVKYTEAATTHLSDGSTFGSEKALTDTGLKASFEPTDLAERAKSLEEIRALIRGKEDLSDNQKIAIDAAVKTIMDNPVTKKTYRQLSVDLKRTEIIDLLKAADSSLDTTNEKVLTVALQKLMEASLNKNDMNDPKNLEAMIAWNKKRVTASLETRFGLDEITAGTIAQKWMDKWADKNQLTQTAIESGSRVSIEVGTQGINGTRSSTWQEGGSILGAVDLMNNQDLNGKLTQETLQAIKDNPLNISLGLAVLDSSDRIFSAKEMNALKIMKSGEGTDPVVLAKFQQILKDLYLKGTWTSPDGVTTITAKNSDLVGLYEKCLNFTEVEKHTLSITQTYSEAKAVGAETEESLKPKTNLEFVGLGAAAAVRTPAETPTTTTTDTGSKTPGGEDIHGQAEHPDIGRATVHPNDANIGTGGTPTE